MQWFWKPKKQLIWSALGVAISVTFVIERIASGSYFWAAFWTVLGFSHAGLIVDEVRKIYRRR
jgi:hypothetical protein